MNKEKHKADMFEVQLDYFIKENEMLRVENARLDFENIGLREIIGSVSESVDTVIVETHGTIWEDHKNMMRKIYDKRSGDTNAG